MWYAGGVQPPDVKNLESWVVSDDVTPSRASACVRGGSSSGCGAILTRTLYRRRGRVLPSCTTTRGCFSGQSGVVMKSVSFRLFFLAIHITEVSAGIKKIPKGSYIGIYAGELF